MNRFDDYYVFRHATIEDCDMIMNFIADEWPRKNHILAVNKPFFLYEFQNGELLNFIIAVNRKTGLIDGIEGYLPSSDIKETLDIWTCMWLTRRSGSVPLLGLEILNRIKTITGYRYLSGVGTNTTTSLPLVKNKATHYEYKLKHFYRLSDCKEFKIAAITNRIIPVKPHGFSQLLLTPALDINDAKDCIEYASQFSIPLKNAWYINKRFFRHPIYKYLVWIYGTSTIPDVRMCKADADQDRPNLV